MGFWSHLFGSSSSEGESDVPGIEISWETELDAPFEGVPTGNEVREQGAPSMFGDYSDYPGGYPQAIRDWRNGSETWTTYASEKAADAEESDEDDTYVEPRKKFLGLF